MTEIESLLREARQLLDAPCQKCPEPDCAACAALLYRIDAALAALREQGESVLPPLPVLSESPVIVGQPGMLKLRIWAENYAKAYGLACYRAGAALKETPKP